MCTSASKQLRGVARNRAEHSHNSSGKPFLLRYKICARRAMLRPSKEITRDFSGDRRNPIRSKISIERYASRAFPPIQLINTVAFEFSRLSSWSRINGTEVMSNAACEGFNLKSAGNRFEIPLGSARLAITPSRAMIRTVSPDLSVLLQILTTTAGPITAWSVFLSLSFGN